MAGMSEALKAHLASGVTTICRAWAVTRRDGAMLGFTDHDTELSFEGVVFQPETGMTAAALAQSSTTRRAQRRTSRTPRVCA